MAATATIGSALIGAAGSIGGGLLSSSGGGGDSGLDRSQKRQLGVERAQKARQELEGRLSAEVAREQATATEAGRLGLFTSIGDIGTYEESYEDYTRRRQEGLFGAAATAPSGTDSLFRDISKTGRIKENIPYVEAFEDRARRAGFSEEEIEAGLPGVGRRMRKAARDKHTATQFEVEAKGKALNVPEFLKRAKQSRQFRMVSRLTAEADQLMRREGPLWEQFNKSVLGGIYEGAAALQKEQNKRISDALARGGSARRQGLAVVQRMRAAEQVNRQRQQTLWQSKLKLDDYIRSNAVRQLEFNQDWVNNHEGVRDNFAKTMDNLATFYGRTIMPSAMAASSQLGSNAVAQQQVATQRQEQKDGIGQMVSGLGNMLFGAAMGGVGGGGAPTGGPMGGGQITGAVPTGGPAPGFGILSP